MKKAFILLLVPVMIVLLQSSGPGQKIDIKKVKTDCGFISGKLTADGKIKIFMGVPFAAPPLNDLRWKPPQKHETWQGVKECITPPPSAMQAKPAPFMMWSKEFMAPEEPISEDCLYLNIWSPAVEKDEKLPVIVWIHGGGLTGGSGTVPLYDGEAMARKGVIFITINYRLGIFGFLAHPGLSAESKDHVSGNYGILDQVEALKWVSRNIASFGGNPSNVTIDGQSAGSFSVSALMISPLAKGLFQRAIGESGAVFGNKLRVLTDLKTAEDTGLKYAKGAPIAELRKKPAAELLNNEMGRWGLVVDNVVIPSTEKVFEAGSQNDVPLISGWNSDDGVTMNTMSAEAWKSYALKTYGEKSTEFLRIFPAENDEQAKASQKQISQLAFGWQNYAWAKHQAVAGKSKAYLYLFSRVPPGEPAYGAFHSAEFGYALGNLSKWDRPFTAWDRELSDIMSSYWVNFARTGDPNGIGLPRWDAFEPRNPRVIIFGDKVESVPLPEREQLEFMDNINN